MRSSLVATVTALSAWMTLHSNAVGLGCVGLFGMCPLVLWILMRWGPPGYRVERKRGDAR